MISTTISHQAAEKRAQKRLPQHQQTSKADFIVLCCDLALLAWEKKGPALLGSSRSSCCCRTDCTRYFFFRPLSSTSAAGAAVLLCQVFKGRTLLHWQEEPFFLFWYIHTQSTFMCHKARPGLPHCGFSLRGHLKSLFLCWWYDVDFKSHVTCMSLENLLSWWISGWWDCLLWESRVWETLVLLSH